MELQQTVLSHAYKWCEFRLKYVFLFKNQLRYVYLSVSLDIAFCHAEVYLRSDEVEELPEWWQQELLYFTVPHVVSQQIS